MQTLKSNKKTSHLIFVALLREEYHSLLLMGFFETIKEGLSPEQRTFRFCMYLK
jgi:hypothetical protein